MTEKTSEGRKLSDEEYDRVMSWMQEHYRSGKCPACGSNSWGLDREIFFLMLMDRLDRGMPLVAVTCQKCRYVNLHAIRATGLVGFDSTEEEQEQ